MASDLSRVPAYQHTMQRLEEAKRLTPQGVDYWRAREIMGILGYIAWENFENVIEKSRRALEGSGENPSHHVLESKVMMGVGKGAMREAGDHVLSRPACYLIAMNGDPTKPEIAAAQAYFAIQTRRAELADEAEESDFKRIQSRERVRVAARRVAGVAHDKGVRRYPLFQNARYEGLYEKSSREVHSLKGVPPGESLLEYAGHLELAAHAFQMELATEKLANDFTSGEAHAIKTNREVGQRVRQTMIDEVGYGPEKLPLEKEPIKAVIARRTPRARKLK